MSDSLFFSLIVMIADTRLVGFELKSHRRFFLFSFLSTILLIFFLIQNRWFLGQVTVSLTADATL